MFSEQLGLFLRNYEEEIEASAKDVGAPGSGERLGG